LPQIWKWIGAEATIRRAVAQETRFVRMFWKVRERLLSVPQARVPAGAGGRKHASYTSRVD
jgi:hypothetical protein